MKQFFTCNLKCMATLTMSLFMLLFTTAKINAQWIELAGINGSPFNGGINGVATDAFGNVYAGGGFTNSNGSYYVAKWNGKVWSELGGANSAFNNAISTIATDAVGNVYIGGRFTDCQWQ